MNHAPSMEPTQPNRQVAFYSDALAAGRRYGLSRYAWELHTHLRQIAAPVEIRTVSAQVEAEADDLSELQPAHQRLPWGRKLTAASWTFTGWPLLETWTPWADVVHCVELDYRVPTHRPLVVTVHDLGPLTHPAFFTGSHPWLLRAALRAAERHADQFICVSQATADAVEGLLGRSLGERLAIVPEGVSEIFFEPVDQSALAKTGPLLTEGWPFFLWAGSLNPRKNLPAVVRAFERVSHELPHHLILTGGLGWDTDPILQSVGESAVRNRIHLPGRVSDEELRGLYQRATGFVYASLMEGFGLPILEAMASGCPVITSNLSSMPEVAGDAAWLVDPHDPDDLAAAMHGLAKDSGRRDGLRQKGERRARGFRWDTCARAVARIYEAVARPVPRRKPVTTLNPLVFKTRPETE